jgi:hypothetical protein
MVCQWVVAVGTKYGRFPYFPQEGVRGEEGETGKGSQGETEFRFPLARIFSCFSRHAMTARRVGAWFYFACCGVDSLHGRMAASNARAGQSKC